LVSIGFSFFSGLGAGSQKERAAARSAARVRSPGTLSATAPWLLYLPVPTFPSEEPMQSRKKLIKTMKNQSEPIENQKKICKNQKTKRKQYFGPWSLYLQPVVQKYCFFWGFLFLVFTLCFLVF
jgi:hypothetical protein